MGRSDIIIFFLDFPIYLQAVEIHSANGVLGWRGRVEEHPSVIKWWEPCVAGGKKGYKLRLTTEAYNTKL
jgi:hypothetical protein